MLINLMFHDLVTVSSDECQKKFELFLVNILKKFNIVVPGDDLNAGLHKHNVCFVFDDAYCDFFYIVYPLLLKYQVKALLALPTYFVKDNSTRGKEDRLNLIASSPLKCGQCYPCDSICSWQEITEMVASSYVIPVSHTHQHLNLKQAEDIESELQLSQKLIEQYTSVKTPTLVLPYGATDDRVLNASRNYYTYIMRIGSAINYHWVSRAGYSYRINADCFWPYSAFLPSSMPLKYRLKYMSNIIRGC